MFARGTAAEILAREQHRRPAEALLVQHEVGIQRTLRIVHPRLPVVEITPFVEQVRPESGALDRFQELLGNDRVGVDVGTIERRDQSFFSDEFFH
ncbi:hypothetical protein D3C83_24250 [compost metagenome]